MFDKCTCTSVFLNRSRVNSRRYSMRFMGYATCISYCTWHLSICILLEVGEKYKFVFLAYSILSPQRLSSNFGTLLQIYQYTYMLKRKQNAFLFLNWCTCIQNVEVLRLCMNNISFLHFLAFHNALKDYFTTFWFSYLSQWCTRVSCRSGLHRWIRMKWSVASVAPFYTQQILKHITIENWTNMATERERWQTLRILSIFIESCQL